jgi:hypothetical protein
MDAERPSREPMPMLINKREAVADRDAVSREEFVVAACSVAAQVAAGGVGVIARGVENDRTGDLLDHSTRGVECGERVSAGRVTRKYRECEQGQREE